MAEDYSLDFGNVEYLSSAKLSRLVACAKEVKEKGGRFILYNVSPQVQEVFQITQLDKFFDLRFQGPPKDEAP